MRLKAAISVALVSACSAAGGPQAAPQLDTARIWTGTRAERFQIDSPHLRRSTARRFNTDLADKAGRIPAPTDGYIITNRVIVQADHEARVLGALGDVPGVRVEPASVSDHWIVSTASVAEAVALADSLRSDARIKSVYVNVQTPISLRSIPGDPNIELQWHLINTPVPLADVNADGVWNLGYSGAGVTVGICESGWQQSHVELAGNLNADASQPGSDLNTSHGTSVAGVVGAIADNELGGAGLAYNAQLSGQLIGTFEQIADALAFRNDLNDIKNNSWGPTDNGTLSEMPSIVESAVRDAVTTGRSGAGTILVWAAGNGGLNDRIDYDDYASSRYVIPVGAVGDLDTRASYNELGSAHLVVTHSSGNSRGIYTTTSNNGWTSSFGGTSSAAPLASGVVALMLEANPGLTYRDVQHIFVQTARKVDPANPGWETNAAGHDISYDFGFGVLDALDAVLAAETWSNVAPEVSAASPISAVDTAVPDNDPVGLTRTVDIADDITVEHVELILNVTSTYVGDLALTITAPSGTESVVATTRFDSQDDLIDYVFTSRRHWGESSAGTWTVHIADGAAADFAHWQDFQIVVYGTADAAGCDADLTTTGATVGEPGFGVPDGLVDQADLSFYVNLWVGADPEADVTTQSAPLGDPLYGMPDTLVTGADIFFYVNMWLAECP